MRRFRKATIKEVAKHAGVSTTTVSYFVGGRSDVCSAETAERIRLAVEELHYTPSSLVSGMQTNVRNAFGVCVRSPWDIGLHHGRFFFQRIWQGISEAADLNDYSLVRYPLSVRESGSCDAFLDGRVDGVLFHALASDNLRAAKIASAGMPIVLLTRSIDVPPGCASVYVDESVVMHVGLEHLWELGHRRIAHLGGPVTPYTAANVSLIDDVALSRLGAYVEWMRERGLENPDYLRSVPAWSGIDVTQIVQEWRDMPQRPTAILCANDAIAVSVLGAAEKLGWHVPGDLSVVGIDNSEETFFSTRMLTTIDVHIENISKEGFNCLLNIMGGAKPEDCQIALREATWIDRGSVAPLKAN